MENHNITIENREKIIISRVRDVDAFDEDTLWANLEEGGIEITGEKLNIQKLDLNEGMLVITGKIYSLTYTDKNSHVKQGIFKRLVGKHSK
ncbi:MAG: sporulation protein YabP [Firmicutes bacterium]|nr:sporulation protein YabP [Bacillota bacterium]